MPSRANGFSGACLWGLCPPQLPKFTQGKVEPARPGTEGKQQGQMGPQAQETSHTPALIHHFLSFVGFSLFYLKYENQVAPGYFCSDSQRWIPLLRKRLWILINRELSPDPEAARAKRSAHSKCLPQSHWNTNISCLQKPPSRCFGGHYQAGTCGLKANAKSATRNKQTNQEEIEARLQGT